MKAIMYVFLLACLIPLSVCCSKKAGTGKRPEGKDQQMIQIQSLTVGEKGLVLNYRMINPFPYDIWICKDTHVYDQYHAAETRIATGSLLIRLRLDPTNAFIEEVLAEYWRLSPGRSYSGTLNLELPIRNFSALYGFRDLFKECEPIHVFFYNLIS